MTPSPARSPHLSARQRTLHAALRVLAGGGVGAVTMRAVAEEAGVTATALYRHFADKEQLMGELVRETAALFRDYLGPGMEREQPMDRLLGVLIGARGFALDHPRYYELLFLTAMPAGIRSAKALLQPRPGSDLARLVGIVDACMAAGPLRRDEPVAVALTIASHLHGLLRLWWLGRFGEDRAAFEDFADASFARLFRGLTD